jgi:hypothetical protein
VGEWIGASIGRLHTTALLLTVVLVSGGCVAAGVAAGPLVSAFQAVADRTLERTVPVDLSIAWGASLDTLQRMGFRLDHLDREGDPRVIEGSADRIAVTARLSRVTATMTRLAIRVEAGGITADKDTAEAIAAQVLAQVKATPEARMDAAEAARALDTLRQEVQQLRSTLERERANGPARVTAPAPPTGSGYSVGRPAIVVPTSYGFESPSRLTVGTPSLRGDGAVEQVAPAVGTSSGIDPILVAPLTPVSTLAPVQGLTTPSPNR